MRLRKLDLEDTTWIAMSITWLTKFPISSYKSSTDRWNYSIWSKKKKKGRILRSAKKLVLFLMSKCKRFWLGQRFTLSFFFFRSFSMQQNIYICLSTVLFLCLQVVNEEDRQRILDPHLKILQSIENVKNYTSPHFEEVHEVLYKVKERLQRRLSSGAKLNSKLWQDQGMVIL